MRGTYINVQTPEQLTADTVFRQHSTNGVLDQPLRIFSFDHVGSRFLLAAVVTGVGENHAIRPLLTCHLYFFGIDHNYMIATINMGRITGLMLAANYFGNLAGNAA